MKSNKEYLKSIEELLFDEKKIITYKWLSHNFDISPNVAKQLLAEFAASPTTLCQTHFTYFLSGELANGSFLITLANSSDLIETKKCFKTITSEHVYSVQPSELTDFQVLYAADDRLRINGIKCKESVRFNKPICVLKEIVPENVKKVEIKKKEENASENDKKVEIKNKEENEGKKEQKTIEKNKNAIANMFAKAEIKKTEKETVKRQPERNKEKSQKGVSGLKRKRIQVLSDSESDEDVFRERSPEPETIPEVVLKMSPLESPEPEKKRKKRKIVDNLVMNDDGYMETRKVITMASDSEQEEETPPIVEKEKPKDSPVEPAKKSATASSSKTGKKQASLLSFFKKN